MRSRRARIMMEVVGRRTARIVGREEGGIHTILTLVVMAAIESFLKTRCRRRNLELQNSS